MNTCPECGTAVRADVHWCILCYHDLRQVPEPAQVADAAPRWPCSRCEAQNGYSDATCAICGAPFLAGAGESSGVHLPVVGDVTQMSTLNRYLLALGVALAVIVVIAAVGLLV